ncbi:ABC transporter substrate-binding protein [Spongiactinospora gelatinilytica]|uniref:ABC transporter substrate-binding protein n=1 Tax=Spongiactinospora gelatinilytica TaxID=2666298 RepID=UPI0013145586|nr:ABC transporter substrate-binding protein [Spongiactinospora gelatinilytica]
MVDRKSHRSAVPRRVRLWPVGGALLVAALVAACGGGGSAGRIAAQNPDTLTIAVAAPPQSLNPALAGNGDPLIIPVELAYDPLIQLKPDGSLTPGLATKWGYVGSGNKVFELTLRSGVRFSDGSSLTAQGVADYFAYFAKAGGLGASRVQNFEKVAVTGPLSLRITLKSANPELAYMLTPGFAIGNVISPNGLKDPNRLGTSTAGAGQYVLDAGQSVTNQTYVFTPNPHFWNPEAINWKKVVVKVIPDSNAALGAMRAGQVDYMISNTKSADAAKQAGFDVSTWPYLFGHIQLLDRDGTQVKALGDVRVRQALNHAIDRRALVKALFGKYASPSDQILLPGADGHDPSLNGRYGYDPAKAKSLLRQAGYPNGFSLVMAAYNLQPGETDAAQAVAGHWAKIGVNAKIEVPVSISAYTSGLTGRKYQAQMFEYGGLPMYLVADQLLSTGSLFNPFDNSSPEITKLMREGAAADDASRPEIYKRLQKVLVEQAWFVPFASIDKVTVSRPGLQGVTSSPRSPDPNPVYFTAAKG